MKYLPLCISCVIVLCVLVVSQRFRIPTSVVVFLWALLIVNIYLLRGLQNDTTDSAIYWKVFLLVTFACGVLAAYVAMDLCAVLRRGHFIGLLWSAAFLSSVLGFAFADYICEAYKGTLPQAISVVLIQGAVYSALGIMILGSLAAPIDTIGIALRLSLGSYMLARGICAFGFASGIVRDRSLWLSLNNWLPMLPEILALGLLLIWLVFGQSDLVHQETPSAAIQQGHVVAAQIGGE